MSTQPLPGAEDALCPQTQPSTPPTPKGGKLRLAVIGAVILVAGFFVIGTLPRLRQKAVLAADVKQVQTAIPSVTVVTPSLVSAGGLSLPGNIQALKESAINARTTGYLRRLYVDIGSRVKTGQVLAEIESPDVDQQVYQAMAQTAQSRATVGQSRAQVAQQRAAVAQTQAQVAQQRAVVEQARAQLASSLSTLAQQQAVERQSEALLAHSNQQLDVQRAVLKQTQAQLEFATVSNARYQTLVKEGFDTQQDADQAAATLKTATAGVVSAEAAVQSAQADVVASQQAVAASQAVVATARANVRASQKSVQAAEAALAASEANVWAAQASVQASQSNVEANQATVKANQANTRHYAVMRSFEKVIAPFDGVITARNVDVGALINAGGGVTSSTVTTPTPSAGMLGIARTDQVRIEISAPQTYVPALRSHSTAQVTIREIPGHTFTGSVSLRSGALDTFSRTQLVEVILPNPGGTLVPGMYAQVRVTPTHAPASLRIPGTALIFNAQGTQVASVTSEGKVHLLKVQVGRDFGTNVEIVSGLPAGAQLVDSPPDTLAEGAAVQVLPTQSPPRQGSASPRAS